MASNRHWSTKEKVRKLRYEGLSYSEIRAQVTVAKATISNWCQDIELTQKQQRRLLDKKPGFLKGVTAAQTMYWRLRKEYFEKGKQNYQEFKNDSTFVAGLSLYWAEGSKQHGAAIANSDHRLMKFMIQWFDAYWDTPPASMKIHLHMHSGQDELSLKKFWSKATAIPLTNYYKTFVKQEGSGYRKNILYNGTIKASVASKGSTYLLFQILGALSSLVEASGGGKQKIEDWIKKLPYAHE